MSQPEARYTNLALTNEVIGSEIIPAELLDIVVKPREDTHDEDSMAPIGMTIRHGIYSDCLAKLAFLRAHDRHQSTDLAGPSWRPSLDAGLEIRETMSAARETIELLNNIDDYLRREKHLDGLKEDQVTIFDQMISVFANGKQLDECQAGVVAATGVGKTHLMIELLRAAHNKERAAKQKRPAPIRSLVLTESQDLIRQNSGADGRHGLAVFAPELEVGCYYADEKDLSKEVTVMTYASFIRTAEKGVIKPGDFTVLLADEADLALSYKRHPLLKDFMKNCVSFGFTATGTYNENKHLGQLYERIIYGPNLREAIDQGLATPVQIFNVRSHEKLVLPNAIKYLPEIPDDLLQGLVQRASRNKIAVDFATYFSGKLGVSGLVECLSGEGCRHAYEVAEMIGDQTIVDPSTGLQRKLIASGIDGKHQQRTELIEGFAAGEIDWLCGVDVFKRGIDLPRAAAYIGLRRTYSLVRATQMRGRIPRINPNDPDKLAYFVEVFDDLFYEDGQPLELPCTMTHVLGLEQLNQMAHYLPTETAYDRKTSVRSHLKLGDIPPSLRLLIEQSDFTEIKTAATLRPRAEIMAAQSGWQSIDELRAHGMPQTKIKRLITDWSLKVERMRTPDGVVRTHLPNDAASDMLELHQTETAERHNNRKDLPPLTWTANTDVDFEFTAAALNAFEVAGKPTYLLTPRKVGRSYHRNGERSGYFSHRQMTYIKELMADLPSIGRDPIEIEHIAQKTPERHQTYYLTRTPLTRSASFSLYTMMQELDRAHRPNDHKTEYYAQPEPSPLHEQVRQQYRRRYQIDRGILEAAGVYGRLTKTMRMRRSRDTADQAFVQVGNFITRDELNDLHARVAETYGILPETHVPLQVAMRFSISREDSRKILKSLADSLDDLTLFGLRPGRYLDFPNVEVCASKEQVIAAIKRSDASDDVIDELETYIKNWKDDPARRYDWA